jgi:radical SAM superfamily enzyme YgiQ (UPF0313 family)
VLEGKVEYRIIDGNRESLDAAVEEGGASVVAMTVMPGPQLTDAVSRARALKERDPRVRIAWGGYFPTQHAAACLDAPFVDYVLRGHVDSVFLPFVEALLSDDESPLRAMPGLAYRESDGSVRENPLPPLPSPEELPDYPYHRIETERYVRATFMGRRTLSHHSSYGCPFTCNFCAVVNMVEGRWRAQSAERTASVVERLVRDYRIDSVDFYDNNFFVDESRVLEFSERIEPLGLGWWGEARIDTLLRFSARTWNAMRRSGLRMVYLGAESGSDRALARMNKGGTLTVEKTLEFAAKMKESGIIPELSFMVGSPPEPRKDAEETLAFIRRVKRANPDTEIVLYLYSPVPLEGELYRAATSEGFAFPRTLEEWTSTKWTEFSARRSLSVPWLERSLRRRVWDFERVLNAYYPTRTDRRLRGPMRFLLRSVSAWRYHSKFYRFPLELHLLHRIFSYQRPETSGF